MEVNPLQLSDLGVSLDQVRAALSAANANIPKGSLSNVRRRMVLNDNDQLFVANQYGPLIVAYHNGAPGAPLRRGHGGRWAATIGCNAGIVNGKPSVLLGIYRQPDANIIDTVDRVRALLPFLQASIPPSIRISVSQDRTTTIRASVRDVEVTLVISVLLVILVVFRFPAQRLGHGHSQRRRPVLSGGHFRRHVPGGLHHRQPFPDGPDDLHRLRGGRCHRGDRKHHPLSGKGHGAAGSGSAGLAEIGFTVLSMSTSLIAVFIPILLMGGIVGRMFREFAVTLSAAVAISMVVSLTTTPMMCADSSSRRGRRKAQPSLRGQRARDSKRCTTPTPAACDWVLRASAVVFGVFLGTVCLAVYLYVIVPKGFFPQQDTGRLNGAALGPRTFPSSPCARS